MKKKHSIIGITGGSSSGKSTVARNVLEAVGPEDVTYMQQDAYYLDLGHIPLDIRKKMNFDHLEAFDNALLLEHLKQLQSGQAINRPLYDFKEFTRVGSELVEPRSVILVEGILVFALEELRQMLDIKIYVDTDSDIRLMRRIQRDVIERGRSLEFVIKQYTEIVRPAHQEFIEPTRRFADVVIPEGGSNQVAMDMLVTQIRSLLVD